MTRYMEEFRAVEVTLGGRESDFFILRFIVLQSECIFGVGNLPYCHRPFELGAGNCWHFGYRCQGGAVEIGGVGGRFGIRHLEGNSCCRRNYDSSCKRTVVHEIHWVGVAFIGSMRCYFSRSSLEGAVSVHPPH